MATIKARNKLRAGTAAAWGSANPVLLAGEPGVETDTKRMRIGDGVTAFVSLPFVQFGVAEYQVVTSVLTSLNTLGTGPNRGLYFSAINTLAEFDLTPVGRAFLAAVSAEAQRTAIDAQKADAALTSLAALDLAAGDMLYATGPDTLAKLGKSTDGKVMTLDAGLPAWKDAISTGSVLAATAAAAAGAVGTYAFAKRGVGNTDVAFGATAAGSDLRPTSAGTTVFATGAALAGTWRAMGHYDYVLTTTGGTSENPTSTNHYGVTLWLRIA